MLTILDFRYLLIVSSIANNFFLVIGVISAHYVSLCLFFVLYTLTLHFLLVLMHNFLKPLLVSEYHKLSLLFFSSFLLFNIASLPPFPIFISKFLLIYDFISCYTSFTGLVVLSVVVNVTIAVSYCQLVIKYFSQVYSNSSLYFFY